MAPSLPSQRWEIMQFGGRTQSCNKSQGSEHQGLAWYLTKGVICTSEDLPVTWALELGFWKSPKQRMRTEISTFVAEELCQTESIT